jgi:serine/threonine protein kinase
VVHCDVKPGNVLVNQQGKIFLADFGIAKFVGATTTTTMGVAGTPAYMAPEQVVGRGVAPVTDIYALGVMLFEMLTGQRPFRGTEPGSETAGNTPNERIRFAHLRILPPDPRRINPLVSPNLANMMLRGLAKNPAERYQSAVDFYLALCNIERVNPNDVLDETTVIGEPVSRSLPLRIEGKSPTKPRLPSGNDSPSKPYVAKKTKPTWTPINVVFLTIGVFVILAVSGVALVNLLPPAYPVTQPSIVTLEEQVVVAEQTFAYPVVEFLTPTVSATPEATRTLVVPPDTATPFTLPTLTFTPTETSIPTFTPQPEPPTESPTDASSVPSPQGDCPAGYVYGETVEVPFGGGTIARTTNNSYDNNILLIVSGTGQAENKKRTDAFYMYTDNAGIPLRQPTHPQGGILSINKKIVDKFLTGNRPPYNPSHVYQFSISVPGGPIIFGVYDTKMHDNTGGYTITVCY